MRGVVDGFGRGGFVCAGGEVYLDVFADVDAGDAGVAHVFEGFFDSDTLRVNDRLLGCDDDFSFHANRVVLPRKIGRHGGECGGAGRGIFVCGEV